ncbi:MAG: hypothetical protein LBU89_13545 [Fibromonadaceae bacterium]|jgi:hypothetical protein|nr:hypothetical protein [Fibromonadaceae bacterium]
MRYILLFLVLASFSFAEPLSLGKPNEEKEHSPWINVGFGIGILSPTTDGYKEQGKAFANPSLLFSIQFAELTATTLELDLTKPDGGWGVWFGVEQQFIERQVTPFAELQVGARYPGKHKRSDMNSFGDAFGVATSVNGGVIFFRESQFRIRLKGGYEGIFNQSTDMSWNAEIGVLFALGRAGLKTIKVD